MTLRKLRIEHDGYVVVRRPLLPLCRLDEFYQYCSVKETHSTRELVEKLLDNPNVEAAIKLATPGLVGRARSSPPPERIDSVLISLTKYLVRMTTRCTPYSAFATVALGKIGESMPFTKNEPICRLELDCGVLADLADRIQNRIPLDKHTQVKLNPTAYRVRDEVRYFERTLVADTYNYSLAAITRTPHIDHLIDLLEKRPTSMASAVASLSDFDDEITDDDYFNYVHELVGSSLLAVDAGVQMTKANPILSYINSLQRSISPTEIIEERELLQSIARALNPTLGCSIEDAVRRVSEVEAIVSAANIKVAPGRVVHIDTFSEDSKLSVPPNTITALTDAVQRLHALFPKRTNQNIADFLSAFEKRFGDRFVPLSSALDPETGVQFAAASPLASWPKKLGLRSANRTNDKDVETKLQALMSKFLTSKESEIDLESFDLLPATSIQQIPLSFSVHATFFDTSTDDIGGTNISAQLHNISYPGSTNLIARFAARDDRMAEKMQRSIVREESNFPDTILAEIVHSPQPRMGNILSRPSVRSYEIVLSDQGSVEFSNQIRLTELSVGVVDGEVVLWHTRLQRRVIPCLTSAYNFGTPKNIGLFQFLCHLSRQGNAAPSFQWPASFDGVEYLPRVVSGRVVLASARWLIQQDCLKEIALLGEKEQWATISELLTAKRIPRYFVVEQGDQRLEIDRDNWLALMMFISLTKKLARIQLRESTSRMGEPLFKDGKEKWNCEVVLPLHVIQTDSNVRPAFNKRVAAAAARSSPINSAESDGGEWFFYKIYGGEHQVANLMIQQIFPEISRGLQEGHIEKWHFVRYSDPNFHFRLRVYGKVGTADAYFHSIIARKVMPELRAHQISAVNREVYLPEVVRYSGQACLTLIESIFSSDSNFCAVVVTVAEEESSDEWLWKSAFAAVVEYINVLEKHGVDARSFVKQQRDIFRNEMDIRAPTFDKMGEDYRSRRAYVESCITREPKLHPRIESALARRRAEQEPIFELLNSEVCADQMNASLFELMGSIVHMQCNRLFAGGSRPQEYILWDYLDRAFRSMGAKA